MAITRVKFRDLLTSMRPTLLLMGGRSVGFVATFAIPVVLVRSLDPADFGVYRLVFLVYSSVYLLAQIGMAESLYYFVPQRPDRAARSVANSVTTLAVTGAVVGGVMCLAARPIGRWLGIELVAELPRLAIFVAAMLCSASFEIVLVARKQYSSAAGIYAASDVARAAFLTVPALIFRSVDALMMGAIGFACLRAVFFARFVRQEFRGTFRTDSSIWKDQCRYALPFAAAVTIEVVQASFHQYAVASWVDPATFAIYSIGCLQIPLVDLLSTSAANVMMVSMTELVVKGESPLRLWHETIERLAFVFVPLATALILLSREVIVFLYTPHYAASAPIFAISTGLIVLGSFPVDAVLRVYAETRFLFLLNLLRLALIASCIGLLVKAIQLPGAMLATLLVAVISRLIAIGYVGRLMHARVRDLLPWGMLARTVAAAGLALVPALWVKAHAGVGGLALILLTAATYGLAYLACMSVGWPFGASARATAQATARSEV
jgi:O-antigen/teichoic acid export membrane protein